MQKVNEFIAIREAAKEYPYASEAGIRGWIARASVNGFDKVIIRIGGRIFLKRSEFETWLGVGKSDEN